MFKNKEYLDYSDVLIKPRLSGFDSRKDVLVSRWYIGVKSKTAFTSTPIIIANLDTTGTFEVSRALYKHDISVALHKFYTPTQLGASRVNDWVTIGMRDTNWKEKVWCARTHKIIIDVANGYMVGFLEFIAKVRKAFPEHYIMAGNICTPDIIHLYAEAGVDAIKVGIGQGALCRTRVTAGVGVPQFTAVLDCAKRAKRFKLHVCADGGISEYADFSKALVAGADFVMAGSIFTGHDETSDEFYNGEEKFKVTYGMSSATAMNKHYGGKEAHRASEGRTVLVPYRGSIDTTAEEILGSIRSTMTYTDSGCIEDLKKAQWIRVNNVVNNTFINQTIGH